MQAKLKEIEMLLRAGRVQDAYQILSGLRRGVVSVELRCEFAKLATRANLPKLALRVLNPIVRPTAKTAQEVTPKEAAEYAFALIRMGATYEALELLKDVDPTHCPEVLLYQSYAHFSHWDYVVTIPLLQRYLTHSSLNEYQTTIAKANLASALVHERSPDAESLLNDLEKITQSQNYRLLNTSVLILRAEFEISRSDWKKAAHALDAAEKNIDSRESLDFLFIEKWRAVMALLQKRSAATLASLDAVRALAVRLKHWETLRQCDYYEAVISKDEALFQKVYFGTCHESLRTRLEREFGDHSPLPSTYDWVINASEKKGKMIDVLVSPGGDARGMKVGQAPFRLLQILATDFYRPIRVAALHAKLYAGEYFNPISSPGKVHQVVKRLKEWIEESKLPISVHEEDGAYSLVALSACSLRIPTLVKAEGRTSSLIHLVKESFGSEPFTAKEVSERMNLNIWAVIRLLRNAKTAGEVCVTGAGAKTRYYFSATPGAQKKVG